jgi:hypothetical protein
MLGHCKELRESIKEVNGDALERGASSTSMGPRGESGMDNPPLRSAPNPNLKDMKKCFKYPCGYG